MTGFKSAAAFEAALRILPGPDEAARAAALARQSVLTKPAGSLGRLEEIAVFLAGWQARERPRLDRSRVAVFAGNHGVAARGVSAFPPAVTAQMVRNFREGGAAINALAGAAGLELMVVPLELGRPTADFTIGPAMSEDECLVAVNAGAAVVEPGLDLLVLGEMGIGNSTSAAALCAASFSGSATDWVGPGTGVHGIQLSAKLAVVEAGLALHAGADAPLERLRRLGGHEIAALAGAVVAARMARVPVLLDGFICCSAVAPLAVTVPGVVEHCLAGHVSAEPAHQRLLDQLGLEPLLALGMRLGEASGAAVAAGIVRAAVAAHDQMATFAEAGVSDG
ncbi:nicotinate-nucleotide--dimethylbenzimidazole phosphoribosyltransferase [Sphingomonas xinjiangensis]|uniref:Nicotinate-nucleotide--dimethylbenzimidazole phosphoribosyltransferase n=1 Tax=Sphingomonas xinjiangensis TaxID=643568 RepID=A0A840YF62_9SPHN|nr:nicotinate-nucleotide--dimethylbenzimidazole phosphoribosyltransferase [Sphingomonas xinjiangensis]MBB5710945.1 nicotinate-nucleotide--dimethylbenzimidazole phosphoribosyltransferase [Sphingomonas xinjiangensis]